MCLSIRTPKTINFSFGTNGKLMVLGVPIFKHFRINADVDVNLAMLNSTESRSLYTTLPHNLIKDKLVDLIERTFQREGSLYIACTDRNAFFTSDAVRNYNLLSCQTIFILDLALNYVDKL